MAQPQLKICNGRIITPAGILQLGYLLVRDGHIAAVSRNDIDAPGAISIDAKGQYVAPGFIDLHVHGGGGHDFMDGSVTAFLKIAETHARYGTTGLLPTTLTCSHEELLHILSLYDQACLENTSGAQFLGMHLEGPYLSMNQRGAQDARFIRYPDPKEYKEILKRFSCVKRWDAAPDLDGALAFGQYLQMQGIIAGMAHTDAIYEEVAVAVKRGYSLATHLYSAMSGVTRRNAYRYAGMVESALLMDEIDVEIIADGVHLPTALLKLVYKVKGAGRTALITDAMRGAGQPEGDSILGSIHNGLKVIIENGVAKLPDRSAFAGSVATANRLVKVMVTQAEVSLTDAIQMITATPARILGMANRKGTLETGKDADIVIFDDQFDVSLTMVQGRVVYKASSM